MSLHDVAHFQEERGKKLSKFIKLRPGESFTGVYVDVVNAESNKYREPDGTLTVNAEFTFNILEEEKKFVLRAASKGTRDLINTMKILEVQPGDSLKITRTGHGKETIYQVQKVDGNMPKNVPSEIDNIFKG